MFALVLLALLPYSSSYWNKPASPSDGDRVSITGRAVDRNGLPVVDAVITVYSLPHMQGLFPLSEPMPRELSPF